MAGRGTGPDFVEALARGLDVLACFGPDRPAMTLSEVAAASCTSFSMAGSTRSKSAVEVRGCSASNPNSSRLRASIVTASVRTCQSKVPMSATSSAATSRCSLRWPASAAMRWSWMSVSVPYQPVMAPAASCTGRPRLMNQR